jgi:predicted DNA-binding transcriptional regulator AlpA
MIEKKKPVKRVNKKQQTKKALIEALAQTLGVVTSACKIVGIDRTTFYKYINEDEAFAKAVKDISEVAIDFAESKLYEQIKNNNTTSTIFYLKTKAKHRGYVERQEIKQETSGSITFDFN